VFLLYLGERTEKLRSNEFFLETCDFGAEDVGRQMQKKPARYSQAD